MNETELREIPIFAPLSTETRQEIAQVLRPKRLHAGDLLIREGETGDCVFIVVDGKLDVFQKAADATPHVLHSVGPGALLGEMSLFDVNHARTASVRAQMDATVLEMAHDDFEGLLRRRPELAAELVREMSARLLQSNAVTISNLTAKNRELAAAYEALKEAQAQIIEKEILERDLARAREIQASFLPRSMPDLPGFDFGALMTPARAVGGDFYDFIRLDEQRLGVVIADVSGKGMPAALFMALTCSLLRAEATRWPTPADLLLAVNRQMLEMNQTGMFVTLIYGVLDASTQRFSYARAGHNIPIIIGRHTAPRSLEFGRGQVLGLFDTPQLDVREVALSPDAHLLLYTDGVTDVLNAHDEDYGEERLLADLIGKTPPTAQALCDLVAKNTADFQGDATQFDDFTVVAIHAD